MSSRGRNPKNGCLFALAAPGAGVTSERNPLRPTGSTLSTLHLSPAVRPPAGHPTLPVWPSRFPDPNPSMRALMIRSNQYTLVTCHLIRLDSSPSVSSWQLDFSTCHSELLHQHALHRGALGLLGHRTHLSPHRRSVSEVAPHFTLPDQPVRVLLQLGLARPIRFPCVGLGRPSRVPPPPAPERCPLCSTRELDLPKHERRRVHTRRRTAEAVLGRSGHRLRVWPCWHLPMKPTL